METVETILEPGLRLAPLIILSAAIIVFIIIKKSVSLRQRSILRFGLLSADIFLAIFSLLIWPYWAVGDAGWGTFERPFALGLRCEREQKLNDAIIYYDRIYVDSMMQEGIFMTAFDFKARCHFLLGDADSAITQCNDRIIRVSEFYRGLKSERLGSAKRSAIAMELQKEGKYAEALPYCGEMISLSGKIANEPMKIFGDDIIDDSYYRGSSEGYIRKYFSLIKLGKEKEAKELLETYKALYRSSVIENPWKKLRKLRPEK